MQDEEKKKAIDRLIRGLLTFHGRGIVDGVAIVFVSTKGDTAQCVAGNIGVSMIGALEILKKEILEDMPLEEKDPLKLELI